MEPWLLAASVLGATFVIIMVIIIIRRAYAILDGSIQFHIVPSPKTKTSDQVDEVGGGDYNRRGAGEV
jgi:hypothetical protein